MHAGYRCRHAGVCCAEDWTIAVEPPLLHRLESALAAGELLPERRAGRHFETAPAPAPDGQAVVARSGGACVFFEPGRGRLCAIHRTMGHAMLPSACRHFPRVVTLDPRGVFVSLSHVCPTAGRLLAHDCAAPFSVVHAGAVLDPVTDWEGVDARDALPPQVNEAALWDWDGLTAWERGVLGALAGRPPEHALAAVASAAARVSRWRPGRDRLARVVARAFDDGPDDPGRPIDVARLDALARARAARPEACPPQSPPGAGFDEGWRALAPQIGRYLAARAVASAVAYHASTVLVLARWLDTAYAVLRTEAARHAGVAGRPVDTGLLAAAAADADRLLVHRLDAAALAHALAGTR